MSYQRNHIAVRGFSWLMKFSGHLQRFMAGLVPPPFRLLQTGSAYWQSRALYTAARLDIATLLADDTRDAGDLARSLDADADAIHRLLRMLAAMGIFREVSPRRFRNNGVSAYLREDNPSNVRSMILMHNSEVMSRPWYEHLEAGVRGGEVPFELEHGEELYPYMDAHAGFDALFARAMDSVEALVGDSYATDFDWGRFDRVFDIGGSSGKKSLALLRRWPGLRAVVVDRHSVVKDAREHWMEQRDAPDAARLEFREGDMLGSVPAAETGREIYFLSAVLHGFDDATCIATLRNLAMAAGTSGARIAVMEMVLPETGADLAGASFDMQMFVCTRGRERTLEEWRALAHAAGMELEEVVGLRSFGGIMVFRPGT